MSTKNEAENLELAKNLDIGSVEIALSTSVPIDEFAKTIIKCLKSNNIAKISLNYDGSGDDGYINECDLINTDDNSSPIECALINLSLEDFGISKSVSGGGCFSFKDIIENLAWEIIRINHSGFENNEGGSGNITLSFNDDNLIIHHDMFDRCISTDYAANQRYHDLSDIKVPAASSSKSIEEFIKEQAALYESLGIAEIVVRYIGIGDSGDIDDVSYSSKDGKPIIHETSSEMFDFFYNLGEAKDPGYEINEGGGGSFTIRIVDGMITEVEHESYYNDESQEHRDVTMKSPTSPRHVNSDTPLARL